MTQKLILVLNCGSSSLKGAVLDNESGEVLLSCLAEKLNLPDAYITFKVNGEKHKVDLSAKPDHTGAVEALMEELKAHGLDSRIGAIGHRVVSGGELYSESILVDDEVIAGIEKCIPLAPLHNPAHLLGLRAAQSIFKGLPNVVVFDTAFHQTMPEHAYTYAIPHELYEKYGLRRYGAHGTSYRYVSDETARFLGKDKKDLRMVIAHLGNGASIAAVANGECKDTSMGLTPLEGLVMGTRSGDIDPSVFSFLAENANMTITQITDMLNKNQVCSAFQVCPMTAVPSKKKPPTATQVPNWLWKSSSTASPNTSAAWLSQPAVLTHSSSPAVSAKTPTSSASAYWATWASSV